MIINGAKACQSVNAKMSAVFREIKIRRPSYGCFYGGKLCVVIWFAVNCGVKGGLLRCETRLFACLKSLVCGLKHDVLPLFYCVFAGKTSLIVCTNCVLSCVTIMMPVAYVCTPESGLYASGDEKNQDVAAVERQGKSKR